MYTSGMKHLRVMLIFLLLGFLVNVGVAATLGWFSPSVDTEDEKIGGISVIGDFRTWYVAVRRSRGRMGILSVWVTKSGGGKGITMSNREGTPEEVLPYWAMKFAHPVDNGCQRTFRIIGGYGWPMLSLWSGVENCNMVGVTGTPALGAYTSSHGYFSGRASIKYPWAAADVSRIPYGPIWSGLLVNTLLYAAILFGLFTMTRTYRHVSRRRRGLCQYCAYDLREVEHERCPECGRA